MARNKKYAPRAKSATAKSTDSSAPKIKRKTKPAGPKAEKYGVLHSYFLRKRSARQQDSGHGEEVLEETDGGAARRGGGSRKKAVARSARGRDGARAKVSRKKGKIQMQSFKKASKKRQPVIVPTAFAMTGAVKVNPIYEASPPPQPSGYDPATARSCDKTPKSHDTNRPAFYGQRAIIRRTKRQEMISAVLT